MPDYPKTIREFRAALTDFGGATGSQKFYRVIVAP